MLLRRLKERDLPRVGEIFGEAFGVQSPDPQYLAALVATEPEGCLVAERADRVIGYVISHRAGRVGYIGTVAVESAHRGKGHGRALTVAARDHLAARCEVVGLAAEAEAGRNLELYASCGFVPTLPSVFLFRRVGQAAPASGAEFVRTGRELGAAGPGAVEQVRRWSDEVHPGLDLSADLELFLRCWPDRVWFHQRDGEVDGVLADHEHFRGDPWGIVRPGPGDLEALGRLIDAREQQASGEFSFFHVHACFGRVIDLLRQRGFRIASSKSCMLLPGARWPTSSEALLVRPWWT